MRPRRHCLVALAMSAIALGALSGCASGGWDARQEMPAAVGTPGDGFAPSSSPSPEATIHPEPGSWDTVHPSPGYRVVLLTAGDDAPTRTLADSVTAWAHDESVELRTVRSDGAPIDAIVAAMELNPDLIVSVGNGLVDPLATVSANHLDEQFLVVGAEIAEPTANVTAVDWTGAAFRGEGLGTSSEYDPLTFTSERADRAIRAGAAAVLTGLTGVVLWID